MTRRPRVSMATPLFGLIAGLVIWFIAPTLLAVARQEVSPAPVEVGSGPIRERSLEFTGRNIYRPDTVEMFGYLSTVIGLDSPLLFSEDSPSESTARFTYKGDAAVSSRSNRGDVTEFEGAGVLQVFLDDTGASWDDPATFADGQPVAELSIHLRDTLHRQAPGVGVLVGDGELAQDMAVEFNLGGQDYRIGDVGIEQRLRYVGTLLNGGAEPPSFAVSLTGNASVVAREAIPVNVGQLPPTAATPSVEACPALQPWLDQTMDGLNQTQALIAAIEPNADLTSLDADAVRQAAVDTASLRETQRGIAPPADAAEANRLVVTAMSTQARGLELMATAATEADADLLQQGQSVAADGVQLLERAEVEVTALAAACESPPVPALESD